MTIGDDVKRSMTIDQSRPCPGQLCEVYPLNRIGLTHLSSGYACMMGASLWQIANDSSIPTWMSLMSKHTPPWRAAWAQCLLWYRGCQNSVKEGMFSIQPILSHAQTGSVSEQQTRLRQPRGDHGLSSG